MARRKRISKKNKQAIVTAVIVLVLAAVSALYTGFQEQLNLPSWDEIYDKAGIETGTKIPEAPFSVTYIDVGQGDSALIISGEFTMLIDGGEKEYADKVLKVLKDNSVKELTYVVATHPHADHIGALPEVIDHMTVKNVIMPKLSKEQTPTTRTYENFLISVKNSGANVIGAKPGSKYELGDASFEVLGPVADDKDLNNTSVVIKVSHGDNSFLFTGDAEKKSENAIVFAGADVTADVLKLGHHGSSTSTGETFLKKVKPKIAIISVGKDNDYGHPSDKTLELLNKYNIETYLTQERGDITLTSDGKEISVKCAKDGSE